MIERAYEELRAVIDGGSESMTHADALQTCREHADLWAEYWELYVQAQWEAAVHIWASIHRHAGDPRWQYGTAPSGLLGEVCT